MEVRESFGGNRSSSARRRRVAFAVVEGGDIGSLSSPCATRRGLTCREDGSSEGRAAMLRGCAVEVEQEIISLLCVASCLVSSIGIIVCICLQELNLSRCWLVGLDRQVRCQIGDKMPKLTESTRTKRHTGVLQPYKCLEIFHQRRRVTARHREPVTSPSSFPEPVVCMP